MALFKFIFYIFIGGWIYYLIEILYRGKSHYSMFICGGLSFYLISRMQHSIDRMQIRKQSSPSIFLLRMLLSSLLITILEFLFGIVFNLMLHQQVWDYSKEPFHLYGQICPKYSFFWFLLSGPVLLFDKWLKKQFHII